MGQERRLDDPTPLVDELEGLLRQSVERRLRGDVPVVSYISGGLDSTVVLGLSSRHRGEAVPSFTIGFDKAGPDERAESTESAAALGSKLTTISLSSPEIAASYPELVLAAEGPVMDTSCASLIKRAIRDVYSRDVEELIVDGEDGWRAARDYMRTLMPTHAKKVQLWPQGAQPLFAHNHVEAMLDAMLNPVVQLRSGGYLVINQTEALVAIDVNSGRSTRERGIEETALRTNLEAAEEAARQLRLRDLAGLIVIDFIDMESKRHNTMVERRMADALKDDRARIQIGHISHFGLLELSRQRLRPSFAETTLTLCAACGGSGHVRSTESAALHVLRELEEEGSKRRAAEVLVHVAGATAFLHPQQQAAAPDGDRGPLRHARVLRGRRGAGGVADPHRAAPRGRAARVALGADARPDGSAPPRAGRGTGGRRRRGRGRNAAEPHRGGRVGGRIGRGRGRVRCG